MALRRGFTLVELLVVIAIIGILVGLLLPAVNAAREQGRLTTCKNNLHQLQVACEQHVDKFNFFPGGGWGNTFAGLPDQGTGASQPGGWIYQLLPYMDQEVLHDLGKGSASTHLTVISTALPGLYCPTRRASKAYPPGTSASNPWNASVFGRTDYAGNGGSYYITFTASSVPKTAPAPPNFSWPDLSPFNGIFAVHSQIAPPAVKDNKDTTYLFGEKYMAMDHYTDSQDAGDLYPATSGDDLSTIRWSCLNCRTGASVGQNSLSLPPAQDRASTNNNAPANGSQRFGSSHSAGWNAAFVSGNVQLIGWGIDPTVHVAMSTRDGHEVVDPTQIPK